MGYNASGTGKLTLPGTENDFVQAAYAAHPHLVTASSVDVFFALYALAESDEICEDDGQFEVAYVSNYGGWIITALDRLAKLGVTGSIEFRGEDSEEWMLILADGAVTEQNPVKFYPGNPDENADAMALSRKQARSVLALIAGDEVDGLDEVVKRLTAAAS